MLSINSSFVFLEFNALEPCSKVVYFEYSNIFSGERLGLPAGLVCACLRLTWWYYHKLKTQFVGGG